MIDRYTRPQIQKIFNDENKFSIMLKVEILASEAMCRLGLVPKEALRAIKKKASFNIKNIRKLEETTRHDVVAFISDVSHNIGKFSKYIHMGLTSSDVLDTTLAVMMKEAVDLLLEDLSGLAAVLKRQALRYKDIVCIGRTHGIHAEPITFGFKMALFYDETQRNIIRLRQLRDVVTIAKISGAVGTYANVNPYVESYVCKKLGLQPAKISTQIIQRDIHAQFLTTLALVGCSLEKFATEIRSLQKTEVQEAEEFFSKGQKGSSAMPHKRNPVRSERICGLSRLLKGNAIVGMENVTLWHERDISHSSNERVVIPDSAIVLDYMLNEMIDIISTLVVYPENMLANLNKTKGLIFSQQMMLRLIEKGLTRQDAYKLIQDASMYAYTHRLDFRNVALKDKKINRVLSQKEILDCFNYKYYLRYIYRIFRRVGICPIKKLKVKR